MSNYLGRPRRSKNNLRRPRKVRKNDLCRRSATEGSGGIALTKDWPQKESRELPAQTLKRLLAAPAPDWYPALSGGECELGVECSVTRAMCKPQACPRPGHAPTLSSKAGNTRVCSMPKHVTDGRCCLYGVRVRVLPSSAFGSAAYRSVKHHPPN